jgi:hypothetical protein
MIALVELHINYLVSEKVFRFSVFIISLSVFYLLYASGVHEANTTLLYYSQQYQKEFTIEMVNFGKLLSMIYLLFITIVGYVIHQYDVIILNRVSFMKHKVSKGYTILLLVSYFISIYMMFFVIISSYLVPYMIVDQVMISIYIDLLFFCFFYTVIFVYLYELTKHLFGLILGFLLYVILFIGSVNQIKKEDVNTGMKILYRIGLDLGYYEEIGFDFYYQKSYYIILLLAIGAMIFFLRKNVDLIN